MSDTTDPNRFEFTNDRLAAQLLFVSNTAAQATARCASPDY
jgi:hypothetical protein